MFAKNYLWRLPMPWLPCSQYSVQQLLLLPDSVSGHPITVCAAGSSEEPWSRGQFMTNVQSNNAGPRSGVCYICSFVKENKNMVKIYYRHFSSSVWKALRRVTWTLYRYMVQACVASLVYEFLTECDNNNCLYQLILLLLITETFRQNYYA